LASSQVLSPHRAIKPQNASPSSDGPDTETRANIIKNGDDRAKLRRLATVMIAARDHSTQYANETRAL